MNWQKNIGNELDYCYHRKRQESEGVFAKITKLCWMVCYDWPKRCTMEGIAEGLWPLESKVYPLCQMVNWWHIGKSVSRSVWRCGFGKSEHRIYLYKDAWKRQQWRKMEDKVIGHTWGWLNTKIHVVEDSLGNPIAFLLSAGNDHDCVHSVEVLEKLG